ncbi:hypothetical protein Tco_0220043, partial [Tanacetum coccineum]
VRLAYCLGKGYALPLVRDMRWARVHLLSLLDLMDILGETMDEMLMGMPGTPATDETELGRRVTNLVTTVRHDINEIYERLDDAQTERQMVTSQVNMLVRDRRAHARGSTAVRDCGVAGNRPQEIDTVDRGPEIDEDTTDTVDSTLESTGTR